MTAWLLALVLCAAPTSESVVSDASTLSPHKLDWLAVPLLNYSADTGVGYGAAAQVQAVGSVQPYRYQLTAQALFTSTGVQSHWLRLDVPSLLGGPLRLWARAEYHRENAPYYGPGNETTATEPALGPSALRYDREVPVGRLGAQLALGGPFHVFAFGTGKSVNVSAAAGSLLALQRPLGFEGGHVLELAAGADFDTRDSENAPTRGVLLELSGRGSDVASSWSYLGATARMLAFAPLGPRLVLATRLEADVLSAGAPFFEWVNFGGADAIDGIGGVYSARGVPQDRYSGREKALGTAELRAHLGDAWFEGEPLAFGAVVFLDVGRVWQPGVDGPNEGIGLHPCGGSGLRLWRRAFVVRADVATSPDRPLSAYLAFGQFF